MRRRTRGARGFWRCFCCCSTERELLGRGGDLTGSYFPEEPPSKIQVPRGRTQDFRGTREVDIEGEYNVVSNTSTEGLLFFLSHPQVTEIALTVFFVVCRISFYIGVSELISNSFMLAFSCVVSVHFICFYCNMFELYNMY